MSIADKITRLTVARNDIRTALNGKGVEASDHGFEDFADDIDSISGGGGDGSMLIEASEMTLTYTGVGPSGKWDSYNEDGHTKSRYIVMEDGRYTITASSMAALTYVVTEIGSTGATATFSPDYPTRIVLQPHTQTVFENCAGMYLFVRSDSGDANGAVFPTIEYQEEQGGGSAYPSWDDEPNTVELIDYDGLVLKSMSASEFLALSDYPSFPNPTGLVHAGWNWPFAKAQEYVQKYGRIEVGRLYYTDTGDTRVYITIRSIKTITLKMNQTASSGVTIDWGDGSAVETSAASTGNITPAHTYENEGNYVIKISVTSGTLALGTTANSSYGVFLSGSSIQRKIEIGRGVNKFNQYAFWHNYALRTISMTPDITSFGVNFLSTCFKLRCFIYPNGTTTTPNPSNDNANFGCERYLFPPSVTSIGQQGNTSDTTGGHLQCVRGLTLPEITSIPGYGFFQLANVDTVVIPSTITSIGKYGLANMWSMYQLYCYPTTPPTIQSTTFNNIRGDCVIHVPAASLEAYQAATNWSAQASKMVGDL